MLVLCAHQRLSGSVHAQANQVSFLTHREEVGNGTQVVEGDPDNADLPCMIEDCGRFGKRYMFFQLQIQLQIISALGMYLKLLRSD